MKIKSTLKIINNPILRLCVIVMGACIILLGAIFSLTYWRMTNKVLADSIDFAKLDVDKATEIVDRHLTTIEITAENLSATRIRTYRSEKDIYDLLERFVAAAPEVWGIAIGYEPGVVPGKDKGFAPYVRNAGDSIERFDLYAAGRDYLNVKWYRQAFDGQNCEWSKPFRDVKDALITCYCMPLLDENSEKIGVIAVDLQLDNFADELIYEIHPYEHSECMVLDEDFDFIVHPDHSMILSSYVDYAYKASTDSLSIQNVLWNMHHGRNGYEKYVKSNNQRGMLFYAPINKTNWTVALSVPMQDVFKDSFALARNMFILCVSGILILVFACAYIFKKIRKEVEDKVGIEKELSMAHSIQMSMVKKVFPPYPDRDDIDVYATLIPAKEVGGDLYDFAIHGDIFHFCIGDVSGKGVPASLFMATTRTLYRSIIAHENSPSKIAVALNDSISSDNDENMFVTMYIGALNLKTGRLTVCNCGHNAPLISNEQDEMQYLTLPPINIPIGVVEGFDYKEFELELQTSFRMFVYSDGITEAENSAHELYGESRLAQTLNGIDKADASAQVEIDRVLTSVKEYAAGYTQSDDITMLPVHYSRTNNP